ncbi:MAG: hypothetical protein ABSH20_29000 [Tepidisphaeraceae bacterium]|jgi:hypothetical protein
MKTIDRIMRRFVLAGLAAGIAGGVCAAEGETLSVPTTRPAPGGVSVSREVVVEGKLTDELDELRVMAERESSQVAAPDSGEGFLRSLGVRWVRVPGEITMGAFVEDILEGRLNQPQGRGVIGRVVFIHKEQRVAVVDFGRNYVVGIQLSELSLLKLDKGEAKDEPVADERNLNARVVSTTRPSDVSDTGVWKSNQVAAADSMEGRLRSQGSRWGRVAGKIGVGDHVQDMLEGRLGQPQGRGAIGKVLAINKGENDRLVAEVDFGRDYVVGIQASELSLVKLENAVSTPE